MASKRIADIEEHKVKSGESIKSLADANGLTWQELAKFNWGTDAPAQINERLRDEVGCTLRDAQGNYIFDSADKPGIVLIPKKFEANGLVTDKTHTLRVLQVTPPKTLLECVCVPGGTFEFDKSFIHPSIAPHIKKLEKAIKKFPDAKIIVFGHTDRVGDEMYNKKLSERRAESTYAFVTDQPDIWERLYNQENWGTRVIQTILKDLGNDPGPIDGVKGEQTSAAIKQFQGANGLAVDGNAGTSTRKKLFLNYMTGKRDVKVADAQFAPPKFMGCGEFNPLVEPNANELANRAPGNEPNRRIVFYLFKNAPTIPCKIGDIAPCKQEIAKPGPREKPLYRCAFYDRLAFQCKCEQHPPGKDARCDIEVPNLTKKHYAEDRAHFDLEVEDSVLLITSEIKFVKGWAGEVVQLGSSVPASTGGLLDGSFTWNGYRWMKRVGTARQYWNGSVWRNLPTGFVLADSNNFAVGFYKVTEGGTDKFRCQYGGDWPESFTDWDINAPDKQARIEAWEKNIATKWTGKFDIKRKECASTVPTHCRYKTEASAEFLEQATFSEGLLIIADGNIRANDSLFFLGDTDDETAGHEFGHHLGNPDEYAGASSVDTSLNEDGAVNGIDATSVMGQSMKLVKKRHYRTICRHLSDMGSDELGKTYTYEAVPTLL